MTSPPNNPKDNHNFHFGDGPYAAKHMPYAKYFQIATVKPNGRPANRTVVFRGFVGKRQYTTITTSFTAYKPS
jgi:hypothetical protein